VAGLATVSMFRVNNIEAVARPPARRGGPEFRGDDKNRKEKLQTVLF
jgi:hypothetical protein